VNRKLVTSEAQIVALVVDALAKTEGSESIEAMLGVEFAYADGRYLSDLEAATPDDGDCSWEEQPVDYTTYRRREGACFPASYPALVMYSFDDDYDRGASVKTRMLTYVEQHELSSKKEVPR